MSKQKQKGSKFETKVLNFLRDEGFDAYRNPLHGAKDQGDIRLASGRVAVECKNQARHSLGEWLDEATTAAHHAGADCGVVIFHRRGKGNAADDYALMDLRALTYLLREAGLTGTPTRGDL